MTGRTRRNGCECVATSLILLAAAACSTGPTSARQTGALVGTISAGWSASGAGISPLAGVSVTVTPQSGRSLPPVMTDSLGDYLVPHVPLDSSTVAFGNAPSGCAPFKQSFYLQYPGDTADVVEIIPCTGSSIRAIVTGGPSGLMPPRTLATGPSHAQWDVFGTGTMTGLPPGLYTIEVDAHLYAAGPIVSAVYGRSVSDTTLLLADHSADTVTITVGPPRGGTQELWIGALGASGISAVTQTQLLASGPLTPVVSLSTAGASMTQAHALAVDTGGNIWVGGGSVLAQYTPAQLAAGGSPTPRTVITLPLSGSTVTALAADYSGDLWVADSAGAAVYGYTANQLATSGSPTPTYRVSTPGTLKAPVGMLPGFVGSDFWIADAGSNTIWAYEGSAVLQATNGAPLAPADTADLSAVLGGMSAMTTDNAANFWVTDGSDTMAAFSSAQLNQAGRQTPARTGVLIVPGANAHVRAMTVDNSGDMWVLTSGTNQLLEYAAGEIPSDLNVQPTATFTITTAPLSLLFNPSGVGFGINAQRVHLPTHDRPLTSTTRPFPPRRISAPMLR